MVAAATMPVRCSFVVALVCGAAAICGLFWVGPPGRSWISGEVLGQGDIRRIGQSLSAFVLPPMGSPLRVAGERAGPRSVVMKDVPPSSQWDTEVSRWSLQSSWETPFTVVSSLQLVEGIEPPGHADLAVLTGNVTSYVEALKKEGAVVVADFEGEMPGHGGELVTAAFLPTGAVDRDTLKWLPAEGKPVERGLLLDLRCGLGVKVLKEIMESTQITKLIWGADMDLQSLMHQKYPMMFLDVHPRQVVDVQLAFSEPNFRLGMSKMLERIPARFVEGLPSKGQIAFDEFHSRNRRAMALPLSRIHAAYAMDDLHRIEAILRSKPPPGGSYQRARDMTDVTVRQTREDPFGLKSLRTDMEWFKNKRGVGMLSMAVRIKRHILAMRARGGQVQQDNFVAGAEAAVDAALDHAEVRIPEDLSFSDFDVYGYDDYDDYDSNVGRDYHDYDD